MSPEIIAVVVGLVIAWLVFTWAVKVLKASLSTAFAIAILLFALNMFFGIQYQQLWEICSQFIQQLFVN